MKKKKLSLLTCKRASEFLQIARKQRRWPLLKASFSLRPKAKKETKSGWSALAKRAAQEAIADSIASFTSSFPAGTDDGSKSLL